MYVYTDINKPCNIERFEKKTHLCKFPVLMHFGCVCTRMKAIIWLRFDCR
jgi:hypothetical protein